MLQGDSNSIVKWQSRNAAVVGWRRSRLEQGYALHFQMPAQGGHQHGIHGTASADRDFPLFFLVDRDQHPLGEPVSSIAAVQGLADTMIGSDRCNMWDGA